MTEANLTDASVEATWRASALYAPPEDLERWLQQLGINSPSPTATAGAKRITRHHSHTYTPPLDTLSTAKRQQSMPAPACKRVVFRQRSRQDHHAYGGIKHPSETRMHVAAPQSRRSSSRGSSRSSVERAVRSTQHAQRTAAERDGQSQRLLRSNSARVAAAAAAAAAAFGSETQLPEVEVEAGTAHSVPHTAHAAATQPNVETTVGEDHTANMRRMQRSSDQRPPVSQDPVAAAVAEGSETFNRETQAHKAQPDVIVFERPSPFLPPLAEPQAAPLHASESRRKAYPANLPAPASEGSVSRRMLQPVPSFNEWGSMHSSGSVDAVDATAACVWAAGCILFEMLYGYHPFQMEAGESLEQWVAKVQSLDIKWPESGVSL